MDGTISSLLDRLQGFFSKSFLLAGFLPLAAALILNGLLLQWVYPQARPVLHDLLLPDTGSVLPNWVLLIVFTYVSGMALASLNPWLRRLLEGRYLPSFFQDWKRRQLYAELLAKQEARLTLHKTLFALRKARHPSSGWAEELKKARLAGEKRPDPGTPVDPDLKTKYITLKGRQWHWQPVSLEELQALYTPLCIELCSRPASKLKDLDDIQVGFTDLLEYACGKAEIEYSRADAAIRLRFPRRVGSLQCTELANLVEVHREYSLDRFGLDSELFELRLLKPVRADANFSPLLEDAKTYLDFAVVITVLLGVTVCIWLPLSMLFAPTIWPFLLVAGIGLPGVVIFYDIVIQAYGSFAEIVRAALDLYRFDLLKALHLPLPENLDVEKESWQKLADLAAWRGVKLTYQHSEAEAKETGVTTTPADKPAPGRGFWERLKDWLRVR